MSAIEADKHFEALSAHYFIGHRLPSDRAWRHAEFRAALLYICKRNWHPANNIDACESRSPGGAIVAISPWHAYDLMSMFCSTLAQPRNRLRTPRHRHTPPRSCSSGDLQRDRVQRLSCLEERRHIAGSRNGSLGWRCCDLRRT